ncbi:kinase-like protein [Rhizoctonia solani]|uniref:Kinase-like protein n=1 Tax=Rhizoctonia solani TaxID=456999 RepID=A0A8H7HIF7_9AGAM|nr:kinase-like protein [Rhizoctonia solani]
MSQDENVAYICDNTPLQDIVSFLVQHGCKDLTKRIPTKDIPAQVAAYGGACDVYKWKLNECEPEDTNSTPIAIKTLRCTSHSGAETRLPKVGFNEQRAAKELLTWTHLDHPNILPLLGFATFKGQSSMVSPWIPNGNLSAYLRDNQCSDTDRITSCEQIRAGLAYMHSGDMIHGDLKGANVMASTRRIAMITDFGNTILKDLARSFAPTTTFGITYQYAPPEHLVARSIPIATKQSDVYSYAMTVFVRNIMPGAAGMPCEMLTYHPGDPFGEETQYFKHTPPLVQGASQRHPSGALLIALESTNRLSPKDNSGEFGDLLQPLASRDDGRMKNGDYWALNYLGLCKMIAGGHMIVPNRENGLICKGVRMPSWILDALATVRQRYANDRIDIILKAWPSFGEEAPAFRLKCLDCPGMLYNLGPGQTLSNFEIHLKNRTHRANVNKRIITEVSGLMQTTTL